MNSRPQTEDLGASDQQGNNFFKRNKFFLLTFRTLYGKIIITMRSINKDGTPRKQGSGRTKGATSFVNVKLKDITPFIGQETQIPVSRVWLKKIGYTNH